ncbi:2-oxo-4-hydroxy-4-carboxy-5-ureidoimidazoline decarboxylase [Spelaeicoccus albus]|uniref:2-oxo-4-hydroxy-4-carboxy-5-ureidoimidazoline decarboxylase n=1 Tax=Spelaeicoccus albus TaxID=1280376 RepID=A0A7Z0ABW2_9MICO|nr:2-oxo-4-hydroxy-4-carboxy-5-ureidoimidazoline decarboxylase [Spelaeicoccus albus]NYI67351.1 2-oxo-4-hydroxy-4-carboxy-5-ureidoimidazoline decarboxylase [Spelaeicoccus albus]
MQVDEFNAMPRSEVISLLLPCVDIERWAAEVADRRPYTGPDDVSRAGRTAAQPWTDAELDKALTHHPPIGRRADGDSAEAALSRAEQGSLGDTDADLAARLDAGNAAYEDKFGHVFLIRAAGRTRAEILANLSERMTNDPATEREVMAEQLRQIAVLRLGGLFQ